MKQSRAEKLLGSISQSVRQSLLQKIGTDNSKTVVAQRAKQGWRMIDKIFLDKKGKPNLVAMTKGSGMIIIHPNGSVDTYADPAKNPYKEA